MTRRDLKPQLSKWLIRGVLILNISLSLSYVGLWFAAANQDLFWRADFTALYTGGAIVRDGLGARLYDAALQASYQQQILEGRSFKDGVLFYNYPPHAVFLFVPLSYLPLSTAYLVWTGIQVGLLIWSLLLLRRIVREWPLYAQWLLYSAVLALHPLLSTILLGSFTLVVLVSLLQFYLALKDAREVQGGLWLFVGIVKLQNILLPGLMLLGGRRWRAILGAIGVGGLAFVISSVLLVWHTWLDFFNLLRQAAGFFGLYGIDPSAMYNFKGTLTLILGNDQAEVINAMSWVALMLVAAFVLWLWHSPWRVDNPDFELRVALTLLLGMLFAPHLNPQDGLMLIVPALLFYVYLQRRDKPCHAYATFVLSCPAIFLISEFALRGSLGIRVPVIAMMVLAVWMGRALYDEHMLQQAHK